VESAKQQKGQKQQTDKTATKGIGVEELQARLAKLPPSHDLELAARLARLPESHDDPEDEQPEAEPESDEDEGFRPADDPEACKLHEAVYNLAIKLGVAIHAERDEYIHVRKGKEMWEYRGLLDDYHTYQRQVAQRGSGAR